MKNHTTRSIHNLNKLILISFLFINIIFLVSIIFFTKDQLMGYLIYVNILVNFSTVVIYLYINEKNRSEFNHLMEIFKNIVEDKEIETMPKDTTYSENKKFESLIKKSFIKGNLQKKDLNDLKKVFEKFVPKDIYEKVGYMGPEKVSLGHGISKNVTIMFLDIMGFTRISETIAPERALFLLNIYFDGIGEIIYEKGGYVDKFLGDGIMILFEQKSSDEAIKCAIEIQKFIKKFQVSNIGKHINIGIGINSGEVIMGTVGTKQRMDVTVIGDNVNIASRLEGLTRKYNKQIIIGQNTYDVIEDKKDYNINLIGDQKLSGKQKKIKIYSVDIEYKN